MRVLREEDVEIDLELICELSTPVAMAAGEEERKVSAPAVVTL
jgi:hypothetical protein